MNFKILTITIFAIGFNYFNSQACSSFMLKTNTEQIFGHNLDTGGPMPGMVFINNSGTLKTGHTWAQLTSVDMNAGSNISWVSKYGSVTFNAFGRELPDGGMNEKGLFIWEMTGGTTFDEEANRPRLFMSQWMQYQLDNFNSVEEVLNNLSAIGLDGWNWHFFIADKQGATAGIEFIDGVAIVSTKNNMPISLMGNGRYSDDLSFIEEFDGFGGNINIDLTDKNLPGMVKAAKMMNEYGDSENIANYGFDILENISGKVSKWAIIFDVKNMIAYFRTADHPSIKSFSIKSFDFTNGTPVKILNIQDENLSGDVSNDFIDFNHVDNYNLVMEIANKLYEADEFEISKDTLINRMASVYKTSNINSIKKIDGTWVGYAEYPTTGEPAKVDWKIIIENTDGKQSGKITDSAGLLADTEMKNIIFENGILKFTVYSYGYIFKISANVSGNGIEGIFDISDESRKGNFHVQLD